MAPAEDFDGRQLLASDVGVAIVLLDEARNRLVARIWGIPRDQAFLVTILALAALAESVSHKAGRVLAVNVVPPISNEAAVVQTIARYVRTSPGGWSRDPLMFGAFVTAAFVAKSVRPVVSGSLRSVKHSAHVVRADFDHRYGHLFRPNRRRQRHGGAS